ncbi:MAG: hypothetical protein WKF84_09865 [Pyrinomonadaceae bacterium]
MIKRKVELRLNASTASSLKVLNVGDDAYNLGARKICLAHDARPTGVFVRELLAGESFIDDCDAPTGLACPGR